MMQVVPGRPSVHGLTFWVQSADANPPGLQLFGPSSNQIKLQVFPLAKADDDIRARLLYLVSCTGLIANQRYQLRATRNGEFADAWSRTLPEQIAQGERFSVALGSCFCVPRNKGIDSCFPPKLHADNVDPIRFRVLGGDQLYMDAGTNGHPILVGAPDPIARYQRQWNSDPYTKWLRLAPNLALADDHEFWNDYPHKSAWLTWSDSNRDSPLAKKMDRAFGLFQAALNLDATQIDAQVSNRLGSTARSFQLDINPLSFFFLDTRTERDRYDANNPHFSQPAQLQQLQNWARALRGPGILVIPQPLVEKSVSAFQRFTHLIGDANLPDYRADFSLVWEALFAARHDIVILTGDIHYSRMYTVTREPVSQTRVYEVVSSPLARIPAGTSADQTDQGKIEFGGTAARWSKVYADDPQGTYSVVTFTPQSAGVELAVRLWDVGNGGPALRKEAPRIVLR